MGDARSVHTVVESRPTVEGAGVRLRRAIGFEDPSTYDPFLLLDDFSSNRREDFIRGFPWHPHRGIETITYVLGGRVAHSDSLGHEGVIGAGDVQWMTAGSGILHQEMPEGDGRGSLRGFQLWANLPAASKMMAPRYRGHAASEIPGTMTPEGAKIKVIAGRVGGAHGPVRDVVIEPLYLDVELPAGASFAHPTPRDHRAFAYVFEGEGRFEREGGRDAAAGELVLFEEGDRVEAFAGASGLRFLLIAGRPLGEPIAWRGPIVMNTEEELRTAYEELRRGTFIKS